jgi:hypothetical protein
MALVTAGMVYVVLRGWKPGPTKIMNPTYFANPAAIGPILAKRFYVDLRDTQVIVFASSSEIVDSSKVWKEFLLSAHAEGIDFVRHFHIESVGPLSETSEKISDLADIPKVPGRIAIHVPSTEAWWSKSVGSYPSSRMGFFQTPFQLQPGRQDAISETCDRNLPHLQFGCLAREAATRYYRKKLTENKLAAAMDKLPDQLHLLFISEPL